MEDAQDALYELRGAYGRYCMQVAILLHRGWKPATIVAASTTRDISNGLLADLYDARQASNRAAAKLKARGDVLTGDIVEAARQAKTAVEGEWNVTIPMVGQP